MELLKEDNVDAESQFVRPNMDFRLSNVDTEGAYPDQADVDNMSGPTPYHE